MDVQDLGSGEVVKRDDVAKYFRGSGVLDSLPRFTTSTREGGVLLVRRLEFTLLETARTAHWQETRKTDRERDSDRSKRRRGLPALGGRHDTPRSSARCSVFDSGGPTLTTHPRVRLRTVNKGVLQRTGATDLGCESRREDKKKLTLAHYLARRSSDLGENGWHPLAAQRFMRQGCFDRRRTTGRFLRPSVAGASHGCCTSATVIVCAIMQSVPPREDRRQRTHPPLGRDSAIGATGRHPPLPSSGTSF